MCFNWVEVVHAFNSSTEEAKTGRSLEFKANLVYRASSSTTRVIQRNPASKNKQNISVILYLFIPIFILNMV